MINRKFQWVKITAVSVLLCCFFSGCTSTTLFRSMPDGAKVYINDEIVGKTPYEYSDTKIVGTHTIVRLEKDGYEPKEIILVRDEDIDVGALVGGILVPPIPLLWVMKYNPVHTYELTPLVNAGQESTQPEEQAQTKGDKSLSDSQISKLVKLKELLDKGVLTEKEFNVEKEKILSE